MTGLSHLKYKHKITLVIFLFALVPMLLFGAVYAKKTWDERVGLTMEQSRNQLKLAIENLDTFLLLYIQKMAYINSVDQITSYLEMGYSEDLLSDFTFNENVRNIINALIIDNAGVELKIYGIGDNVLNGSYILRIEQLYDNITADDGDLREKLEKLPEEEVLWKFRSSGNRYGSGKSSDWLCLYRKMTSNSGRLLAITEMRISMEQLTGRFDLEIPKGAFILYSKSDGQGVRVLKNNKADEKNISRAFDMYSSKGSADIYRVTDLNVKYNSDHILLFLPYSFINNGIYGYITRAAVIMLVLAALLFFIVEMVSHLLTKRLYLLMENINSNIENVENLHVLDINKVDDDISRVGMEFFQLVRKIKDYYEKISVYDAEKRSLELELLQSRINPHFLYNTLSTMKWTCNSDKMEAVIDSMVAYYRMALNNGNTILEIANELKMTEEYLKIQKFTYVSDFTYEISIPEEVGSCLIIKNLIQPIVENAVLHGINGLLSGGHIRISGKLENEQIIFEIHDNGVGIPADKLEELEHNGGIQSLLGGYGIRNVLKRISLHYGENFGIKIESRENIGTTVIMTIPVVRPVA